jgi:rhodanese-related sulfurtransferase
MTKLWSVPLVVLLFGCHSTSGQPAPSVSPKVVSVPEVAGWLEQRSATPVDANGPDIRREQGIVPGARLLSNSRDYPVSDLPSDRSNKLVFYCGGTMCRASDKAAARAIGFGYKDVNIMRAGIRGWKTAGEPTEVPRS